MHAWLQQSCEGKCEQQWWAPVDICVEVWLPHPQEGVVGPSGEQHVSFPTHHELTFELRSELSLTWAALLRRDLKLVERGV